MCYNLKLSIYVTRINPVKQGTYLYFIKSEIYIHTYYNTLNAKARAWLQTYTYIPNIET